MPRIRKKTSNRGSTNDRKKIQNKVRESRKKKAKAAKKNPQWKSKHKKDPGIPNTFPYKDQILAEIADQRRVAAEEKQRRKDENKIKKKTAQNDEDEDVDDAGSDNDDKADQVFAEVKSLGLAQGFDSIAGLSAKALEGKMLKRREVPIVVDEAEDEEEVPVLINRDLPNLQAVMNEADVIIEVLDARDPLPFRSTHLEELASTSDKRVLLVLNKIDACPRESVASWLTHLRTQHPTLPFRSASAFLAASPDVSAKEKGKGKAKAPTADAIGVDGVLAHLGEFAEKKQDQPLCVAVVGLTNAGKSSFVNSLLRKTAFPIYTLATSSRGPTTTGYAQEVTLDVNGKSIRFIDTPGLAWAVDLDSEDTHSTDNLRARDVLMRSKGRIDRLKDPVSAVQHIVARSNTEDLMLHYSLPAFAAGDTDSFLSCVARANQLVKKKGELDLTGAARIVLRDWSLGKFPWYTQPPASPSSTPLSSEDEAVLATLQTRKDMRKGRGLVKLTCGVVESRKALVDVPWTPTHEKDSEDEDVDLVEGQDHEDAEGEDVDMDDDEEASGGGDLDDEDEDEELEPLVALSGKQKRKRGAEKASAPRKKVSFGPDPKASKQARSAGSSLGKSASGAKDKVTKPAPPKKERKVANTVVKKKPQKNEAAASGAPGQEYNFGQFF